VALAEPEMVAVKLLYLQADIVKGSEAEIVFHDSGVLRQAIGGIALDKEAVTGVLEVAKHAYRSCAKQVGDGAGEAEIELVGAFHAPLAKQVACLASLLAGDGQ